VTDPLPPEAAAALPPAQPRSRRRAGLILAAKLAATAVVLYFVVVALTKGFEDVQWDTVKFRPHFLVLAVAAFLVTKAFAFLTYSTLLGVYGRQVGWRVLLATVWIPQLGKFVPGKVATMAWAMLLLARHKVPPMIVARTVLLLSALMVLVGLVIAVPVIIWVPEIVGPSTLWIVALLLAAGLVILHPRVLLPLMNWGLRRLHRPPFEEAIPLKTYLAAAGTMVGQWVFIGLSNWLVAHAIQTGDEAGLGLGSLVLFISATSLASCVGFLALFAPAGLGVREGVLLVCLTKSGIDAGLASIVVTFTRLLQVVVEVALAGVGYLLLWSRGETRPVAPAAASPAGADPADRN
jgi:hypothetical protein